jgi:uncharacterized membrane protein
VLDLKPPRTPAGHLAEGLVEQWPVYTAYLSSYIYGAVIWLNHKTSFTRIRRMNPGLHWANLGILFTTGLLPFATAMIAHEGQRGNPQDERVAVLLYATVGVLLCASWVWFFHYLCGHPELAKEDVHSRFFTLERGRAWAGVVLYTAAGVLGWFVEPLLALAIFLALPIFYGVTSHGLERTSTSRHRR